MDIALQPVSQIQEVEGLVQINHHAMKQDPVFDWMELYTEQNEDDGTRSALNGALNDPCYEIVKAIADDPTAPNGQRVVGFVHYFQGEHSWSVPNQYTQAEMSHRFYRAPPGRR